MIRTALVMGMETEDRGSMRAALHYFVSFVREKRRDNVSDFTFSRASAFYPLPATPDNTLVVGTAWVPELLIQTCVDSGNDAVVLAAVINMLPNRYTAAGRLTEDFEDSASELYAEAMAQQPDVAHKRAARQASSVIGAIRARVPEARFVLYAAPSRAFDEAQLFRHRPEDTVHTRFKDAWPLPYPALTQLFSESCSSADAWAHTSMLVEAKPSTFV